MNDENSKHHQYSGGFTLIEIAIVVVIIGLLLGGVLKGQEMIRNARAHNVADQGNAVKAALLGFTDRYRALPGDYAAASKNIPGLTASTHDGDGNGRIGYDDSATANTPDATNRAKELGLTWLHLSRSGFISGDYDGSPLVAANEAAWTCPAATCLTNAFNSGLVIAYDDQQTGINAIADTARSNQLWSGKNIPIEIIAELDRKVDDGHPGTGGFKAADGFLGATPTVGQECAKGKDGDSVDTSVPASAVWPDAWDIAGQAGDCGGVYQF